MEGIKHDGEKPQPDLILRGMALAFLEVAKVATFGARKYENDNWMGLTQERIRNAGQRHMLQRLAGEELDEETELSHLAHEAWNKLAELELYLREKRNTDD